MTKEMIDFINYLNEHCKTTDMDHYKLNTRGRKYLKVVEVRNGKESSVYCFIKKDDGGVYKAESWKSPAKGERANIHDKSTYENKADYHGGWLYRY